MKCGSCGHQSNGAPDVCPKCGAPRVAPATCHIHTGVALDKDGKCLICEVQAQKEAEAKKKKK